MSYIHSKSTHLVGSSLGAICHLDDQCQLEDGHSFCDFVIKDAFGKCECKHGRNDDGSCRGKFKGESDGSSVKVSKQYYTLTW